MPHHRSNIKCYFPGYRADCTCGWESSVYHAGAREASFDGFYHTQEAELRAQGKDPATLQAHGVGLEAVEQQLTYQQIIDREA